MKTTILAPFQYIFRASKALLRCHTASAVGAFLALAVPGHRAIAASPGMIGYQGVLTMKGTNYDGMAQFRFALVDASGKTYWSHDGTSTAGSAPASSVAVRVTRGLYFVMLGDTNIANMTQAIPSSLFANSEVYLRVWFEAATGPLQLTPDQRIGSVGYALQAGSVDAGSIQSSMIADGAITSSKLATGAVKAAQVDDGGSAAYEQFLAPSAPLGNTNALPFKDLLPVAGSGEAGLTFAIDGARLGTVVGFAGQEAISEPYSFYVEFVIPRAELDPDGQLGRTGSIAFNRGGRSTSFTGLITACSVSSQGGTNALYALRLESLLAYLALSADYRVFQNVSVPDIVSRVYQPVSPDPPRVSLVSSYAPRGCTVQYAETGLRFMSRLLEDEGIFYFYSANGAILNVGDSAGAYLPAPNSPLIYPGDGTPEVPSGEYIRSFQKAAHQSTKVSTIAMRDFTRRGVQLGTASSAEGIGEVYQFGSSASTTADLKIQAKLRQDRQDVERATMSGASTAPDLRPGYTFALADRTDSGLANTYLVTSVRHAGFRRLVNGKETFYYGNAFEVIPAALGYRPALNSARPVAQACTAEVTGPAGAQTYVDKYGRVKVKFHWDRGSAADETSSAWIRVASPVAGASHGIMFLPRVGDEVLVNFLQGNPDEPVIVGSLYNSDAMPFYPLPGSSQNSVIRSTSTAANVSEIRFEDSPGNEQLEIKAPRVAISTPELKLDGALQINGAQYTRSNSVLAWARVAADGSVSGNSFGVSSITNPRAGVYTVSLTSSAQSASTLIPVAAALVGGQPTTPSAARLVTVDQTYNNSFNVYILSGLGTPVNNAFTVIVSGQ